MSLLIISPKDIYISHRLKEEADKSRADVEIISIQELADRHFEVDPMMYEGLYIRFCYPYFKQTVELAKKFIRAGKKVVDADIANGDVGRGKMPAYEKLKEAGLPIPNTEWLARVKNPKYPFIVKWTYGFGGKNVFLVNNPDDLKKAVSLIPAEELMWQEFIRAEYEYKVITVGYKSLPVILRFAINPTIWRPDFGRVCVIPSDRMQLRKFRNPLNPDYHQDIVKGILPLGQVDDGSDGGLGRYDTITEVINLAEQSSRLLRRELAKVDILQKGGQFYILEVNRWPGLKSFEKLTGYNAVKEFMDYIAKN